MSTQQVPHSSHQPHQSVDLRGDEIDLSALFAKLWQRKIMILALSLLLPLLVTSFHLAKKSLYIPAGYELPLIFSFAGAQKGQYPNGQRFIIDDLIANEVLLAAARKAGAPENIIDATNIGAGNGLTQLVVEQISARLQDNKLTENQLETLNEGLARIKGTARQYGVLSVDTNATTATAQQIKVYLAAIPRIWSDRTINEMGVLEVKHQSINQPFVFNDDASLVKESFRFEGYLELLQQSIEELGQYGFANLAAFGNGNSRRLSELRLDLDSIRAEFNDLFSMVPSAINSQKGGADLISGSLLAAKRLNLELQRSKLENMVKVYDESLSLFDNGRSKTMVADRERPRQSERGYLGGGYSPQLSDQMFDSLLQLGKTVSDAEQRALIIDKRIKAAEQIQDVNLRLARLSSTDAVDYQLLDKENILMLLAKQVELANKIQAEIKAIAGLISQQVLGTTSVLSEPLGPVVEAAKNSTTLKRLMLQVVMALVLGGMLGLFIALVVPARKKEST